jgi:hypothetical protein
MVECNHVLLRKLYRQVEEMYDPKELIELSDEIVRLTNDKRRRITLAKRRVLKPIEGEAKLQPAAATCGVTAKIAAC